MRDLVLHRLALRLYPRRFRERLGASTLALARHEVRRAAIRGRWPAVATHLRTLVDVVVNLPLAWRDASLAGRRPEEMPVSRIPGRPPALDSIGLDLKLALRRLARAPGFAAVATVTLGLALGAATAVFSLVDQVLLRPLPYAHAERLVALWESEEGRDISVSWPNFEDWRARQRSFDALAAYGRTNVTLTGAGDAARLRGLAVTANLLATVGVDPALGRWFGPEADRPDGPAEVVLTDALWSERFGEDPAVLGRSVDLDGEPYRVIGVAPAGFRFPDGIVLAASDLFVPLVRTLGDERLDRESHPGLYAIGRLRADTDLAAARAELDALSSALEAEHPAINTGYRIRSEAALATVVGDARGTLLLVALAVGLVLLVAAANVSGLFLARGWAREGDTGVQLALGAGRRRLARQVVLESLLIGLGAAAVGLAVSWLALGAASPLLAALPRAPEPRLDPRVAVFALVSALVVALATGLLPALRTSAPRDAARAVGGLAGGRREGRLRDLLVGAEVALAVVLVVGAALLLRSLGAVRSLDGGVRAEHVLTFTIGLPEAAYGDPEAARGFYERLLGEVEALPGVRETGGVSVLPFSGSGSQSGVAPVGGGPDAERPTDVAAVLPGYFEALGIELLQGRLFEGSDREGSDPVAIVDESFARTHFGDADPLGRAVRGWGFEAVQIVGVVRHVKHYGVLATSREQLYVPHGQRPFLTMHVVARTATDPLALVPAVRERLARLDPAVPLAAPTTMEDRVARTLRAPYTAATLGSVLAALGALLAVAGVHALVAYTVSRRTREIGVRMALGGPAAAVRSAILLRSLRPALAGVGGGLLAAVATSRGLEAWIHGLSPLDPTSYVVAAGGLSGVILLAGAIPARRITRVDPVRALRTE